MDGNDMRCFGNLAGLHCALLAGNLQDTV